VIQSSCFVCLLLPPPVFPPFAVDGRLQRCCACLPSSAAVSVRRRYTLRDDAALFITFSSSFGTAIVLGRLSPPPLLPPGILRCRRFWQPVAYPARRCLPPQCGASPTSGDADWGRHSLALDDASPLADSLSLFITSQLEGMRTPVFSTRKCAWLSRTLAGFFFFLFLTILPFASRFSPSVLCSSLRVSRHTSHV